MANMSYCRFENTLDDLRDCADALMEAGSLEEFIGDDDNSSLESRKAKLLVAMCIDIADQFGED